MSLSYETEGEHLPVDNLDDIKDERTAPPLPFYTIALVASIVAVFMVQIGTGFEASVDVTAFDKPVFLAQHEYWRILTGATVHGGLAHVAMNSYAFYSFGRIFEMLSNKAHLAIVFLLSALGGGILSLIFVPDGSSVGASGGIVGLVSYLAVYAFRRRRFISYEFRKSLLINIGFILVFGLFLFRIIDNFGHIGGLITGAIYGLIQIPADEYVDPRVAAPAVEIAGLAALGIYLAACGFGILLILRII